MERVACRQLLEVKLYCQPLDRMKVFFGWFVCLFSAQDMNREVVKTDSATARIPELDFEIPAFSQKGGRSWVLELLKQLTFLKHLCWLYVWVRLWSLALYWCSIKREAWLSYGV